MKTLKRFFMIIVSVLLLFVSCAKVENPYNNQVPVNSKGEYAITFTKIPTTKASVAAWSTFGGYDKFQLFTWNADEAIMNPFKVEGEGSEYKYEGVGTQALQYFKKQYDAYNFIGIIPEDASATLTDTTVTVTNVESFVVDDKRVETDIIADSPKEFLYAQATVAKADYGNNVTLPFKHGNALLKLSFKSDKSDTELLDYTPYNPGTPGTPGTPAWDEDVVTYTYSVTGKPFAAQGPVFATSAITQEDIDYVNSKYSTTGTWATYYSSNVAVNGPLNEDMWSYLTGKYPTLASEDLKQWASQVTNSNMKLVHMEVISGSGDSQLDGCIRGWFVNIVNMSNTPQEVHTTVHHDAVPGTPGTPATGLAGIRVFSADSTSTGFVHIAHTLNAKAIVTPVTFAWEDRAAATDSIQFSLPATTVLASEEWSPTTFYAIPGDTDLNYFVVKFSYKYDGTTVYDVRVPLKLPVGGLVAGKYYHYIINITSTGNGTNDPGEAEGDKDVIDIVDNPIVVTVSTTDYTEGTTTTVTI